MRIRHSGICRWAKSARSRFTAPELMLGYWGRPETTSEILRDGWLYTGDLGYMDEDGYVFIVDRKKDVIKPAGFQVWPREVEEVIAKHPAVAEVAVAGVRDEYQGEAVKAFVVLREGQAATVDDIRRLLPAVAHRLQGAEVRRVPHRIAKKLGGQGAASRAVE